MKRPLAALLFLASLPLYAQEKPAYNLSGNWENESSKAVYSMDQTGTSLTLDLGNGVKMKGKLEGLNVSLHYTLTEKDAASRITYQYESGPDGAKEKQDDILALTGKVVDFYGFFVEDDEYGGSIHGQYQDWEAEKEKGKQVTTKPLVARLRLKRKPCGSGKDLRISIHSPIAQAPTEPVVSSKATKGAITLVNNDMDVPAAGIAARLRNANDLLTVEGIPDRDVSPVPGERDLVRIDLAKTSNVEPVFLNVYAMAVQADSARVQDKSGMQAPIAYKDANKDQPIQVWRQSDKTGLVPLPYQLTSDSESLYVEGLRAGRYRLVLFHYPDGDLSKAAAVKAAERGDPNQTPAASDVDLSQDLACRQNARLTVALDDIFQDKRREHVFDVLWGGRALIDGRLWPPNGTYTFGHAGTTATWMRNHPAVGTTPAVADGNLSSVGVNDTGQAKMPTMGEVATVHGGFMPSAAAIGQNATGTGLYTARLTLTYDVEGVRLQRDEPLTVLVPSRLDVAPQGFAFNQIVRGTDTDFAFQAVYHIFDQHNRMLRGPTDPKVYTRQYGARLRMYEALGGVAPFSVIRGNELFWTYPMQAWTDIQLGTAPRIRAKPEGRDQTNTNGEFRDNFRFNLTQAIRNSFDVEVQTKRLALNARIFAANQDIVAIINNDAVEYDVRVARGNLLEAVAPDGLPTGGRGPIGFRMVLGAGGGTQLNTGTPDRVVPNLHP